MPFDQVGFVASESVRLRPATARQGDEATALQTLSALATATGFSGCCRLATCCGWPPAQPPSVETSEEDEDEEDEPEKGEGSAARKRVSKSFQVSVSFHVEAA